MTVVSALRQALSFLDEFELPPDLEAQSPPESRGIPRDSVSMMVTSPNGIQHRKFYDLAEELEPGDLVAVNNSATLPAAVEVEDDLVAHFSTALPGGLRIVEIRERSGHQSSPLLNFPRRSLPLPDGGTIELLSPYPIGTSRLWVAHLQDSEFDSLLSRYGRPIAYRHTSGRFTLEAYQTVFAHQPGSAEMPSAGRPFSDRLVSKLVASGVAVASVTLHTGVSSLEAGEPPYAEWYQVPESTAALINMTRRLGGRVIAVGTTVARAVETAAGSNGLVSPMSGWTELVIEPNTPIRAFDGLITGWHEPNSTHLHMLTAVGGHAAVDESYRQAVELGYLWHEFGDSHLLWKPTR